MKVEDYKLVSGSSPAALEAAVNSLLSRGWVPLGGPAVHEGEMVQAMVSGADSREMAARERDY